MGASFSAVMRRQYTRPSPALAFHPLVTFQSPRSSSVVHVGGTAGVSCGRGGPFHDDGIDRLLPSATVRVGLRIVAGPPLRATPRGTPPPGRPVVQLGGRVQRPADDGARDVGRAGLGGKVVLPVGGQARVVSRKYGA